MKYSVFYWRNNYNREHGISDIAETELKMNEAIALAQSLVDNDYAVAAEVRTEEEEPKPVYYYDGTERHNDAPGNDRYIILSEEGYWNNELGWVENKKDATAFVSKNYELPIGTDVKWIKETDNIFTNLS
jgi:hypothetical protein